MADFQVKGILTLETGAFIGQATAASNSLNGLNKSVSNTSTSMKYLKRSAIAAGLAIGGLAMAGVKATSDYQQAEIAFGTMLGSAEKATAFLKDMRDFAASTPFELPDLLTGSRRLLAMGFQLEDLRPMLTAVGDAASGLGVGADGINRITLALGQMKAKGRVSSQELNQLSETGVPALRYLAEAAGITTAQMQKMIESGAVPADEAIRVLVEGMENGMGAVKGFGGMMEKQSKTMSGLLSTFKDKVRDAFVDGMQRFLPGVSGAFSTMIDKVGPFMETFMNGLEFISDKVGELAGGITTLLKPVFQNFLIPAFKVLAGVIKVALTVLGAIGKVIKNNAGFFQTLVTVIGLVGIAYAGLIIGAKIYNVIAAITLARTKLMVMWTNRQAIATGFLTKAQKLLNLTMAFNPIGLAIAAATLLIGAFVLLWNHSETFRKGAIAVGKVGVLAFGYIIGGVGQLVKAIMFLNTGPLKLFLKVLSYIPGATGKAAKGALNGLNGMTDKVGSFFDESAKKADGWAKSLDGLANKKIKLPEALTKPKEKIKKDKKAADDFAGKLGGAKPKGKKKTPLVKDVAGVLQGYNDYIKNDFAKGFQKGSESARDTILNGLEKLQTVFNEQAKNLKGAPLKNLKDAYAKANEAIRGFIPQAEKTAALLEQVSTDLEDANRAFLDAVKSREEGVAVFVEMMRKPFGEPSELAKSLSSADATVDSIIGTYDKMVAGINKRFEGIDSSKKDVLVSYLTDQTAQLVKLAKRRDAAAKALEESQDYLQDIISAQSNFRSTITGSLKDFGFAMADLSEADGQATVSVIKTASGVMISQMSKSSNGIDKITTQLQERLKSIKEFAANIKVLLGKGVNKTYLQQLLSAGPEAAGSTAALLAGAGSDQLSTINQLYTDIGTVSDTFGNDMANTFYGNSVSMAQAMVKGATDELVSINLAMTTIKDNIELALVPLASLGTNLGTDLAQGLIDSLTAKKAELVALATNIAAAISSAMASALASIGVKGAVVLPTVVVPTIKPPTPTPTPTGPTSNSLDSKNWNKYYPVSTGDNIFHINGAKDPSAVADEVLYNMNKSLLGRR